MQVPVKTRAGQKFYVQVEEEGAQPGPAADGNLAPEGQEMGRGSVLDQTLFSRAVDVIKDVSEDVTTGLMTTDPQPSEVELRLSLGFDASGNVWIFKSGTRASLRLVLKWKLP